MAARQPARALLAIDAGSSRTRVTLLSPRGDALAAVAAKTPSGSDGVTATVSAPALWHQITTLTRGLPAAEHQLAGIAVAAQLGLVVVGESGRAQGDALLWPDGRAAGYVGELERRLGQAARVLGRPVSAELPAAKLLWWADHVPDRLTRARWVLSVKDYLVLRLTGNAVTDETHASYTGWFDVSAREYADAAIRASGITRELLPAARCAAAPAGELTASAARELGIPPGVPVAVGCPDGTAGALGAGATHDGITVDVAGTTDVLLSVVTRPAWSPGSGLVLNAYVLPSLWVAGGPTGMTGGAVEWLSQLMGFPSAADAFAELGTAVLALPVGAHGLSFTPALSGSRFPAWDSAERGVLAGLHTRHSAAHLLRAAHEGVAFALADGIDALRAAGSAVTEIVVVGGLASQPGLVRLRSELWDVPVRVFDGDREATTTGAGMLAGIAGGLFADAEQAAAAMSAPSRQQAPTGTIAREDVREARERWRHAAAFARSGQTARGSITGQAGVQRR